MNEGIGRKLVPDLRNHIRTDPRKSLKPDLWVHLNKRNQRAEGKAKRPIQDLRSRLSRPKADDQNDTEDEEHLYKQRADTEEDVDEGNLFTRKSYEESYLIHVSDVHEEDTDSSKHLEPEEINEY